MKKHYSIILVLLCSQIVFSQTTNKADSLIIAFEHAKNIETKKECGLVASKYFAKTNPIKAIQIAQEALEITTSEIEPLNIDIYYWMAISYCSISEFDSALAKIHKSLALSQNYNNDYKRGVALDELGYIFYKMGKMDSAYVKATEGGVFLVNSTDKDKIAMNIYRRGVYAKMKGDFKSAITLYHKAIELYKAVGKDKMVGQLVANIGNLFNETKDYDNGLKYSFEALNIAIKLKDSGNMAGTYNNIGNAYRLKGLLKQSLKYLIKAKTINEKTGNKLWLSFNLSNIGKIYSQLGDYPKAIININKSIEIKSMLNVKRQLVSSYNSLGSIYLKMDNYKLALTQFEKAIQMSDESGTLEDKQISYYKAAIAKIDLKQFEGAVTYFQMSLVLKDSIFAQEKTTAINEIQTKYETAKNEQIINSLEYDQRLQKSKNWLYLGGIIALLIILVLLFVFFKAKQKKTDALTMQKEMIYKRQNMIDRLEMEKIKRKREELEKELDYKSRQLATHALNMMQKNKMLQELQENLKAYAPKTNSNPDLDNINRTIKRNLNLSDDWALFKKYFEEVNKGFFVNLKKVNPHLSPAEMRLAALIKLRMNIKEAASVLNLAPGSVKTSRYRLSKKLHLEQSDNLTDFIQRI